MCVGSSLTTALDRFLYKPERFISKILLEFGSCMKSHFLWDGIHSTDFIQVKKSINKVRGKSISPLLLECLEAFCNVSL